MKNKVVLVTGANGGLGTYVTQAFLDDGATVVGTSRKIQQSDFNNSNFTAIAAVGPSDTITTGSPNTKGPHVARETPRVDGGFDGRRGRS